MTQHIRTEYQHYLDVFPNYIDTAKSSYFGFVIFTLEFRWKANQFLALSVFDPMRHPAAEKGAS